MRVAGTCWAIVRSALTPPMPGMLMSSRIKSRRMVREDSIACSPDSASNNGSYVYFDSTKDLGLMIELLNADTKK